MTSLGSSVRRLSSCLTATDAAPTDRLRPRLAAVLPRRDELAGRVLFESTSPTDDGFAGWPTAKLQASDLEPAADLQAKITVLNHRDQRGTLTHFDTH
jgi:hypothetical protein